jgi:hypothetical protein
MKVVVVGGHSRNIGKTSVVAGLIRGLRPLAWTAVKITQPRHSAWSGENVPCQQALPEQGFVLTEETNSRERGDTCRFLAPGAQRALWLRVRQAQLAQALPSLFPALDSDDYAIIESNGILSFLRPTVYAVVPDSSRCDFKTSAREFLEQCGAKARLYERRAETEEQCRAKARLYERRAETESSHRLPQRSSHGGTEQS